MPASAVENLLPVRSGHPSACADVEPFTFAQYPIRGAQAFAAMDAFSNRGQLVSHIASVIATLAPIELVFLFFPIVIADGAIHGSSVLPGTL